LFANHSFAPLACHTYRFFMTTYTAQSGGDAVTFVVDYSNKKGESLEGVMTYWQAKKAPRKYWFKGVLQQ
jgi:hypothetical protein